MTAPVFEAWPKIPRLKQTIIVTEKIDGTNAAVGIRPVEGDQVAPFEHAITLDDGSLWAVRAQSRKRHVTPGKQDNAGFAGWVWQHAGLLTEYLGEGLHFGEWWGVGIQRGYDLRERRFSLFNTCRWAWLDDTERAGDGLHADRTALNTAGVHVVPILGQWGELSSEWIQARLDDLTGNGSVAAPGFMQPEGVVVFHPQSQSMFKRLIGPADELPKGLVA